MRAFQRRNRARTSRALRNVDRFGVRRLVAALDLRDPSGTLPLVLLAKRKRRRVAALQRPGTATAVCMPDILAKRP